MTAREIQRRLIAERYRRSFCVPNYTPSGWWECDVFELTKAGYFREYEIKITKADFLADAQKVRSTFVYDHSTRRGENILGLTKHDMLAAHSGLGPVQFYFVVPAGLITYDQVPAFAGLIEMRLYNDRLFEHQLKPAPRLHCTKPDSAIENHARGVCYWRFIKLFLRKPVDVARPAVLPVL